MTILTFGGYRIDQTGLTAQGMARACQRVVSNLESDLADIIARRDPHGVAAVGRHISAAGEAWAQWAAVAAAEKAPVSP